MPTLLITGANRGIGLELCKQYIDLGWQVLATCRTPENAIELNKLQQDNDRQLTVYALDVGQESQIVDLKKQIGESPIDILFNNAGVFAAESSQFGQTKKDVWLDAFNINVISPMKLIETFVENVVKGDKKIIASMSSKMGSIADNGSGGSYAYRSTKTALNMVMTSISKDLESKDITTLILHPGWVRTDMGGPNGELSVEESAAQLIKTLSNATIKETGTFFDIDGSVIPW